MTIDYIQSTPILLYALRINEVYANNYKDALNALCFYCLGSSL